MIKLVMLSVHIFDFDIDKSSEYDTIQLEESPAVSGRSKSGNVAAVTLLYKGYGNIALIKFIRYEDYVWKNGNLKSIG